jgi:hypothetical protein
MNSRCIIYISIFFVLTLGFAQSANWHGRIVSKTKHPLMYWISPHVSAINVLMVDGKRFENVRGIKNFYLPVPGTNDIVFVVDNKDNSITYHVYNMDTREDISIHARGSVFGNSIGSPCPKNKDIVLMTNNLVILCNIDKGAESATPSLANLDTVKSFYYLDLHSKSVVAEKTLYYDSQGKLLLERDRPRANAKRDQ